MEPCREPRERSDCDSPLATSRLRAGNDIDADHRAVGVEAVLVPLFATDNSSTSPHRLSFLFDMSWAG